MITIDKVSFAYRRTKVFNELDLEFLAGNIYGIMGKNGTGKSTLLSIIAGLLFPDKGKITVMGKAPSKRDPDLMSKIFMVPEEFYLPDIPVSDYVEKQRPFYREFDKLKFDQYLSEFGISGNASLQQMSYGQKKKVLISFGLACNTPLLLMDEPTNGLDIVSKNQFKKIIAGALDESKCLIISTHQVRDIENLVDWVCFLDEGKVLLNESMITIAENLMFKVAFEPSEDVLFKETSLHGDMIVAPNRGSERSKIDLELLYKALAENPGAISSLFKKQEIYE